MTWARLDDAILDNPKIVRAGPVGFALHVAAITWCARNLTDGFVPQAKAKQLLATDWSEHNDEDSRAVVWGLSAVSGHCGRDAPEVIESIIRHLVSCELWNDGEDTIGNLGYWLNDYLLYNPSKEQVLALRESRSVAGRNGGSKSASKRQANAKQVLEQTASKPQAKSNPVPDPDPQREDPPNPPGEQTGVHRIAPIDRFGDALRGQLPHQREDVQRVFERFKKVFGPAGAKLGRGDVRADMIAEAIDLHTEPICMLVLKYAPQDGMVSGKTDDKGQKHADARYIFGNKAAFERILREAERREGSATGKLSATEIVRAAQKL